LAGQTKLKLNKKELQIMAAAKQKSTLGVIEGTFVYAKVGQPDTKYQSSELEWSIEVIVDEDVAEAWDDQFQKQKAKKIKVSEFEAKYKIPCPIEGVKNVYGIKLKRQATNDGVPVDENFRPKVYVDNEGGERTEIGQSRKIANGSFGKVSYYISSNDYGTFARLQNVQMEEENFKEYESSGGAAGDEFGSKPVKTEAPRKEVMNARPTKGNADDEGDDPNVPVKVVAKKAASPKKPKAPTDDEDFQDSPF
jgi:hypothetical protein